MIERLTTGIIGLVRRANDAELEDDGAEPRALDVDVATALAEHELTPRGFLAEASNHTLLVQVGERTQGLHAIYKPREGERPLRDFPRGTLCQRESAAWVVSEFLGWSLVPPTVLRDGPMGEGSVQLFLPHDPERHYFALFDEGGHEDDLLRMALFDVLVNNADRKASHVIVGDDDGQVWGVDHGLTFHPHPKLRTVIWEFGGTPLAPAWRERLRGLSEVLRDQEHELTARLRQLLSEEEIEALRMRASSLAEIEAFPEVEKRHRPYPWPLV